MKTEIMKNQKKSFVTYFVVFCALILATFSTAPAATFMVNVDTDQHDSTPGDGKCAAGYRACTLRAAIEEANALSGADEIVFSDSFQAPNAPRTILLALGQLQINDGLTINGPGARQLMIDGNHTSRVFVTSALKKNIFLIKLTIQNGHIYAENSFLTYGAGIWNTNGFLRLEDVTVRNNDATGADPKESEEGGGIYNTGSMQIIRSTISGNKAGAGGGIQNHGTLVVYNSTISDNVSQKIGGGIVNLGFVLVESTTIAANTAQTSGGGVWNYPGAKIEFIFDNTIIADNNAALNPDVDGTVVSYGNNLVENRGNSSGYVASDLPNGTVPLLGVLQDNGGATDTRALLAGSAAINAGSDCPYNNATVCLPVGGTDQRSYGFPRKVGTVDIGAFEYQGGSAPTVKISGKILKPNGRGLNNAIVTIASTDGATRSVETDPLGNYSFDDVATGKSYVIKAESRHYDYALQTLFVTEARDDVNFVSVNK